MLEVAASSLWKACPNSQSSTTRSPMRHLSLQSIFPPNFARSSNALRPISPVLPQRTATIQSLGTPPNLVKPSSNATHFRIIQDQTAGRWFTLRPPLPPPQRVPL
ncbi:hypothetical protein JB92DRAFT_3127062 [Gautieria morchelliformis]|nr:hypothetical protein JB92DRAFT_3127062 [Gautieria morchelliformis]